MKRRGFLKRLAALLPAAAVANVVSKQADAAPKLAPQTVSKTVKTPSKLKPDRFVAMDSCEFFCDCPAERGTVVEIAKFESDMQGGQYSIVRPGSHSGQPIGILLNDVVHVDFKRENVNWHRDEVALGSKVQILQDGWVTVGEFSKPVQVGEPMYYDNAGRLTTAATGKPIGIAMSSSDDEGFVKVKVQLYVNESAKLPLPH